MDRLGLIGCCCPTNISFTQEGYYSKYFDGHGIYKVTLGVECYIYMSIYIYKIFWGKVGGASRWKLRPRLVSGQFLIHTTGLSVTLKK